VGIIRREHKSSIWWRLSISSVEQKQGGLDKMCMCEIG